MSANTNTDILVAGAIAAFSVDLLVYPLDTLKTRIQSPNYSRFYVNASTQKPSPALFRGLYQGVGSVIIATLPSSGAFFTTYERTKALLTHINSSSSSSANGLLPTPLVHATASSLAELVSCALLTPAEVIKQNAQMVKAGSKTNATVQTLAKFRSNPFALWRGYTALAGRNLPFTALQFPMFERLKEVVRKSRDRKGLTTGTILESGAITAFSAGSAGAVAAIITTPIDVIKTRIMLAAVDDAVKEASSASKQSTHARAEGLVDAFGKSVESSKGIAKNFAQSLNPRSSASERDKKSAWRIGKDIVRDQGMTGLWRGGALRGIWTFVGAGLYLGVYESGRVYLAKRRGDHIDEVELL